MSAAIFIPKDTYPADEYVKRLAVVQTPCFGVEFNYDNGTCQSCPLSGSCEGQFLTNLREVSHKMMDTSEPAPVLPPSVEEVPDVEQVEPSSLDEIHEFDAYAGAKCIVCGEEIPSGEKAKYHLREGFWHKACDDDYHRGIRANPSK